MNVSILAAITFSLTSTIALAGQVINVKAQKVLLDISDLPELQAGQKIFLLNADGKRKAVIEIKQIKSGKAVADLLKGQAEVGMTAAPGAAPKKEKKPSVAGKNPSRPHSSFGVLAGMNSNSMKVKLSSTESVSLAGTSFSLKTFFQQKVDGNISARLGVGYESLVANGTLASGSCGGSTKCKINISYLGLDAMIHYSLGKGKWEPWLGGGLGFLIALSKSSNTLDQNKISTNQNILFGGGIDYHLNPGQFIPVEIVYGIFPSNNTASASQIMIRAGYAKSF